MINIVTSHPVTIEILAKVSLVRAQQNLISTIVMVEHRDCSNTLRNASIMNYGKYLSLASVSQSMSQTNSNNIINIKTSVSVNNEGNLKNINFLYSEENILQHLSKTLRK